MKFEFYICELFIYLFFKLTYLKYTIQIKESKYMTRSWAGINQDLRKKKKIEHPTKKYIYL